MTIFKVLFFTLLLKLKKKPPRKWFNITGKCFGKICHLPYERKKRISLKITALPCMIESIIIHLKYFIVLTSKGFYTKCKIKTHLTVTIFVLYHT